eukprot:CAMPEP_0204616782 /NCGR_PEP_ID=MMETSP0717-20131115/3945_1 /ASSEMBLY_ACC=CAM_ASM_000666 /TAXON_ID=230516 /ORGANISM="Chaetoceros curvisetus" /LENGTH=262 /DNA_ID=CAMNT_0051630131 /DNA_START=10 /DNA_END=798 /DNA_ORIENTATION=+
MAPATPKDESSEILVPWANRWSESRIRWHKEDPHHYLIKYENILFPSPSSENTCEESKAEPARVFVPLCGKTVDMKFFAEHKLVSEVVGIDGIKKALVEFADEHPSLKIKEIDGIKAVERFQGNNISLLKGDLFDIDETMTGGKFDVILDRASIVAIDPSLRSKYVEIMGKVLKPGGSILLITIDRRAGTKEAVEKGPPFSVNDSEIERLYSLEWVESITKLDELDEFKDEESKKRWSMQGIDSLFELCYIIKAKNQSRSNL